MSAPCRYLLDTVLSAHGYERGNVRRGFYFTTNDVVISKQKVI